jgi:hypothetical protein
MALAAHALTTLDTVKDELGITGTADDARLERYIDTASRAISSYCSRQLEHGIGIVEKIAGMGTARLMVARTPLLTISKVELDGAALDTTDYELEDGDAGFIRSKVNGFIAARAEVPDLAGDLLVGTEETNYTVTYEGGYVTPSQATDDLPRTLPAEIEEACIQTVVSMYRKRGQDRDIQSESLGDYSVTYAGSNTAIGRGTGGVIPDAAVALLRKYRRWE